MDMEKCGAFIRSCRMKRDLSQQELARELHVTREAVSKWENGRGFPEVSLLQPLAGVLGVTVSELLLGEAGRENDDALDAWLYLTKTEQQRQRKNSLWLVLTVSVLTALHFGCEGGIRLAADLLLGLGAVGMPLLFALCAKVPLGSIVTASFICCFTLVLGELMQIRGRVLTQDWVGLGDTIGVSFALCAALSLATLLVNALLLGGRKR